ncbi:hypothetical protein CCUS01_11001 [Colletotrichum cuscutae]|uniref:Uncharacterized protein n=1 Tax=Colletotrichum cuscutae TaxID=1209917 RepID=A0AAI9XJJ8_9PEZI|nr:hypothetical protein CCUS01_11001 [Colletotrichum cuscutae]
MKARRDKAQFPSHATVWHPPGNRDVASVTFFTDGITVSAMASFSSSLLSLRRVNTASVAATQRNSKGQERLANLTLMPTLLSLVTGRCSAAVPPPPVITDHDPSEPPCPAAGPPQQPICDPAVTAGQLSWGASPTLQKVVPFSLRHQILACPYSTGRALVRSRDYGWVLRAWNSELFRDSVLPMRSWPTARVPGEPLADLLAAARRYENFLTPLGVMSPTFDVKPVCIYRNQLRVPVRGLHIDTLTSYYVVPSLGKEASGWWLESPRLTETARNGTNPKR